MKVKRAGREKALGAYWQVSASAEGLSFRGWLFVPIVRRRWRGQTVLYDDGRHHGLPSIEYERDNHGDWRVVVYNAEVGRGYRRGRSRVVPSRAAALELIERLGAQVEAVFEQAATKVKKEVTK